MLLESQAIIVARKAAARKWIAVYTEQVATEQNTNVEGVAFGRVSRALAVLVLDLRTSDYLAEFDPMGLEQAQKVLNNLSWKNFV